MICDYQSSHLRLIILILLSTNGLSPLHSLHLRLGKFIHLGNAYSQAISPTNALCGTMSCPSNHLSVGNPLHHTLKRLRHVTAHLRAYPYLKRFLCSWQLRTKLRSPDG